MGLLAGTVENGTLFTLEVVAELGAETQQHVFLHIQHPFALFR